MPLPLLLYVATDCDDREYTCSAWQRCRILFREVNFSHDAQADPFVHFIKHGRCSTSTLVLGEGKFKTVVTETSAQAFHRLLNQVVHFLPT